MDIFKVIDNNEYLNKSHDYKTDKNSLCYLLYSYLKENNIKIKHFENFHSTCIKIGISLEKILLDYILKNTNLINIKSKNKKDKIEEDHLFLDENNKTIYYAELKSNLNLDTEKIKATQLKIIKKEEELKERFKDYKTVISLVNLRYLEYKDIPTLTLRYFNNSYVKGLNDYLSLLNLNKIEDYEIYKLIIYKIFEKLNNYK